MRGFNRVCAHQFLLDVLVLIQYACKREHGALTEALGRLHHMPACLEGDHHAWVHRHLQDKAIALQSHVNVYEETA